MLDVTKTFFQTFGIKRDSFGMYPEITDTILLKLICMWNLYCYRKKDRIQLLEYICVRDNVLLTYINYMRYSFDVDYEYIEQRVRLLFERN